MSSKKLFGGPPRKSVAGPPPKASDGAGPGQMKRRASVQETSRQQAWDHWHEHHQYHGPTGTNLDSALTSHLSAETTSFRAVPKTGVIYCSTRANQLGFSMTNEAWSNLGQGAPECGALPNAPQRNFKVTLDSAELNEYAPVDGSRVLREAIANYYNKMFRVGKASQYTYKNVCVTAGGRSGLCRIMACLNRINVGFFIPDYSAYEELLASWSRISPIPILATDSAKPYAFEDVKRSVEGHGLGAILVSNPSNPTGWLVEGDELHKWVDLGIQNECLMIMDEFYSHYLYSEAEGTSGSSPPDPELFSSASYVEDVNSDPVLIVNGMTKNWRLPGWRICWVMGPEDHIEKLAAAGSFLDGGANHPLQLVAASMLDIDFIKQDALALQVHFQAKRDYCVSNLQRLGFIIRHIPRATFYIWADVAGLPEPLNDGVTFFEEALKANVICVPGVFFDVNPHRRRHIHRSDYLTHIRISFGPGMEQLEKGIVSFERMIDKWHKTPTTIPEAA